MKKKIFFIIVVFIAVFNFQNCDSSSVNKDKDGDTLDTVTVIPAFAGTWIHTLPVLPPYLLHSMNLNLVIDTNGTYSLEVIEQPEKTIFSSNGTWTSSKDSVTLIGEHCKILDTLPDPDTLKTMPGELCVTPIILGMPQESDTWSIKTSSLKVPLSAIISDSTLFKTVISVIQAVILTKN